MHQFVSLSQFLIDWIKPPFWSTMAVNILVGFISASIVVAVQLLWKVSKKKLMHSKVRAIFGNDCVANGRYFIAYSKLVIRPDVKDLLINSFRRSQAHNFIYTKEPTINGFEPSIFRVSSTVATCEMRATRYLTEFFTKHTGLAADLIPDSDITHILNISWIGLGGPSSNRKSREVQRSRGNDLVMFNGPDEWVTANPDENGKYYIVKKAGDGNPDFGLILRIRSAPYKNRVWIACMGFDEYGTSGAAWYLCNRWETLLPARKLWNPWSLDNDRNFAAIIEVRNKQDESATLLDGCFFESAKDLLDYCKRNGAKEAKLRVKTPTNMNSCPTSSANFGENSPLLFQGDNQSNFIRKFSRGLVLTSYGGSMASEIYDEISTNGIHIYKLGRKLEDEEENDDPELA